MNKLPQIILIIYFSFFPALAQQKIDPSSLRSPYATLKRQNTEYKKALDNISNYLSNTNMDGWYEAFVLAQTYFVRSEGVKSALVQVLENFENVSQSLLLEAIEVSYTLYKGEMNSNYKTIYENTSDPKVFAYSATCLSSFKNPVLLKMMSEKFPHYKDEPLLKCLEFSLSGGAENKFKNLPPLEEIFKHDFQEGKTIIYSLFREERNYPGISIIKKPDGTFVRDANGEIFYIPQLALSYADIPGYLRNGNTPEGIFSIVGSYISPTESIGPTRNVLTRIPYEVSPSIYYHDSNKGTNWDINDYRSLLPDSWKEYFPLYEAYYAGKSGRKVIIMHGSADDLSFFKEKSYYPHTPTTGCISAIEKWDPESGYNLFSDQARLINALYSTGSDVGFLVVLEVGNEKKPVNIEEIEKYLK